MERVFLNDKLIDIDKATISVTDSGFLYGAGLFETMRSHNGVVFALADHLDRLFFSAQSLSSPSGASLPGIPTRRSVHPAARSFLGFVSIRVGEDVNRPEVRQELRAVDDAGRDVVRVARA